MFCVDWPVLALVFPSLKRKFFVRKVVFREPWRQKEKKEKISPVKVSVKKIYGNDVPFRSVLKEAT